MSGMQILSFVALFILPGIISYLIFRPYAGTLKGKLALSAAGLPVLFGFLDTAYFEQPAGMVMVNFLRMVIPTLIIVALLHYIEGRSTFNASIEVR
jgi:hypothetical protein